MSLAEQIVDFVYAEIGFDDKERIVRQVESLINAHVAPVAERVQPVAVPEESVDTPEFQRLIEHWRNEPYGTRSFENAWVELIAHIDANKARSEVAAVKYGYESGLGAGKCCEAMKQAAAAGPAVQVQEAPQLIVATGNDDPNIFTVVVSIKQGDKTTIVYSKRHCANGDVVGISDLPFTLLNKESK